nr:tripartite tricarboxylate transporter permease [Campylobacter fetus]
MQELYLQLRNIWKRRLRGVATTESANNASAGGAMKPMLTLGIPGSRTTAVLLGALMLYNINPGPTLFSEQPALVWGLIAFLYIGNIMLLVINLPIVRVFAKILQVPYWILVPSIIVLALTGVYYINTSSFALLLSIILGVFGFFLRKLNFSMVTIILGYVLGGIMEDSLRRAFATSGGEIDIFFKVEINLILWLLVAMVICTPFVAKIISKKYKLKR